jgi:hypothetical protein
MKTKKNTVKLTESELNNIITESVKRVLKEDIQGRYMSYNPSASGFDDDYANVSTIQKDNGEFEVMLNEILKAASKAREYARINGDGSWYTFLNSIVGEIRHKAEMDL